MTTFLFFILTLCAVFATFALIAISLELKNTRDVIEDLTAGIDELNMNVRERNATKKFNEPKN